jgi:hypothetical protein
VVNKCLTFRIKLILTNSGLDQQPDFLFGISALSPQFQIASESGLPGVQFCICGAANSIRVNYAMQCNHLLYLSLCAPVPLAFFLPGRCNALEGMFDT